MGFYAFFADFIAVLHAAYVLFVVIALLAILLGWWRGWGWVRNFWFRLGHLLAMLVVAIETVFGWTCPLTDLEKWLRVEAGQESYGGDFLVSLSHGVLFWEFPGWVFNILHVGMALVIIFVFTCVPPRWPLRRSGPQAQSSNPSGCP